MGYVCGDMRGTADLISRERDEYCPDGWGEVFPALGMDGREVWLIVRRCRWGCQGPQTDQDYHQLFNAVKKYLRWWSYGWLHTKELELGFHWMGGYRSRTTQASPSTHRLPGHWVTCRGHQIHDIILGLNMLAKPQLYRVLWDRTRETDDRNSESIVHYQITNLEAKQVASLPASVELWCPILPSEIGNHVSYVDANSYQSSLENRRPGPSWAHTTCARDYRSSPKHSER